MPRVVPSWPAWKASDQGISDVVGSILLVGITVGMTVVLAVLLTVYEGPESPPQADLAVTVIPGEGGWGTGDEQVRIRHLGGQPLPTSIHVLLDIGGVSSHLTGAALGDAWGDGRLAIGETWTTTTSIASTDLVRVHVTGQGGGTSVLLAALTLVPGGSP